MQFWSSKNVKANIQISVTSTIFAVCKNKTASRLYLLCKSCILVILNLFKISLRGKQVSWRQYTFFMLPRMYVRVRSQMNFLLNGNFLTVTFLVVFPHTRWMLQASLELKWKKKRSQAREKCWPCAKIRTYVWQLYVVFSRPPHFMNSVWKYFCLSLKLKV